MTATKEQLQGAVRILQSIAEAIRELKEVPSGHLYAQLCGHMGLSAYTTVIKTLEGAGLVKRHGDLLKWVGPEVTK